MPSKPHALFHQTQARFFDLVTLVLQILDASWLVVATLGSGLAL